MAEATTIVCPACQAKLRLKAAPKAGAKIRCPKCQKPFAVPAPEDDLDPWMTMSEADQPTAEDEEEESEAPVRVKSKSKSKKKKSQSSFDPTKLIVGIGVLVLIGLLIFGLFQGAKLLIAFERPKLDPAYLDLASQGVAMRLDIDSLLNSPLVPASARPADAVARANDSLKSSLGVEMSDTLDIVAALNAPSGPGFMAAGGAKGIGMIRFKKAPRMLLNIEPTDVEGVRCYVRNSLSGRELVTIGTGNTIIFGDENLLRQTITNWKAGKKPTATIEFRPGLMTFHVGNQTLQPQLNQAASMGGGFGGPNPFAKIAQSFVNSKADVQLAITTTTAIAAEISLFTPTPEQLSQLKTEIETFRTEMKPMAGMLAAMGGAAQGADTIQTALNSPLDSSGNRISLSIPLPGEASAPLFQATSVFFKLFEDFKGQTGPSTQMPNMPTGMPTPGMPTPGMPTPGPAGAPAMHTPLGPIPMPTATPPM